MSQEEDESGVTGFQVDKVVGKGPGQVLGFVVGERLCKAGRSVPACWECSVPLLATVCLLTAIGMG